MTDFIRLFIPSYFVLFFVITFLGVSLNVARRIGKNPGVFPKDDSAYAFIGRYFKIILLALFIYTILIAWIPDQIRQSFTIEFLTVQAIQYGGIVLMILALIWTVTAQLQMKDSWRIGIDHEMKTTLITHGLFRVSRNPIFLGMTVSLLGFFLVFPTLIALIFLLTGSLLMQIQIRLEEEYLLQIHGQIYLTYKKRVARMLNLY
ncbi:isoprenylcysteine carboxylmethyltransferase family protein [Chryseobacterium phosphatilyticum]|uniref:Isoprenylcysteine carboxylmethyltransferase family protein n=1 Tax=Chryseobacterium phosphatilyticum TaxID=475075 RepID=A0A316XF58_9FLAO|nr:isoprenylcysteine carboxylmethyltransferase family protein [Chryseobacterium phosphatilyticum]PWN71366.1 isoprenylcysteine carboxylmethyltransferase family protein [Chryseobacterium phosphatilyticum]